MSMMMMMMIIVRYLVNVAVKLCGCGGGATYRLVSLVSS